MGTIARMSVALAMDSSDFDKGVQEAQRKAESFGKKLQSAGTAMSAAVTLPLVGIAAAALKSAGDFESTMNVMQSITGATGDQMEAMTQQALKLGAETSFSAGEAAEGMLELGKAGLATNDIMGAMPGVLSLAAAGNMDVGTAAEIAANAVNTFGLEASDTTEVANMLAAAANASSADVSDLAQGLKMSGSVFAAMGQDMSDLTTGMALMSNAGISGSDAGTSLKTMMMRLAAPTKEAAGAMAELGLNVYNADGSMKSFESIVGQLEKATAGLTTEQKNVALSTIFGADAIRAAVVMTEAGAEGFADMEKQVNKAGAAEKAAAARMKGLTGAIDYLTGSIDSVMIALGSQFLPALADMVRFVADLITGFTTLSPEIQMAAIAFAAVLAAAGPLMLALTGIGTALGFLLSPIGLIVVGVAALAAAWVSNFGGIRNVTMSVLGLIIDGLQSFSLYIGAVLEDGDYLNDWLTHLPTAIQPAVEKFGEMVAELKKWFDLATTGDFSGLWTEIGNALNSVRIAVAEFDWVDYITKLDWGAYIKTVLDWGTYITATLTSWGVYVTQLDWGSYIKTALEWGTYITATLTDWGTYVTKLDWGGYIKTVLDWGTYITATLSDWSAYITSIDWGGFITATLATWDSYVTKLGWGDYISKLWTGYVPKLSWADYVSKLNWDNYATKLDWTLWIPALVWTVVITPVRWASWIPQLLWDNVISKFSWSGFIQAITNWDTWVSMLEWSTLVFPVLWPAFIDKLGVTQWIEAIGASPQWKSFISKLDWLAVIPGFNWPDWITKLGWGDFVDKMVWPSISAPTWLDFIDDLEWPSIKAPKWEDFIPDLSWPSIPSFPGWADIMRALGWGGPPAGAPGTAATGQVPDNVGTTGGTGGMITPPGGIGLPADLFKASGGPVSRGVPYIVGDGPGPEMFVPNQSGTIIPNHELGGWMADLVGAGAGGGAPMIGVANVYNEVDIRALAYQVAEYQARRR